MTDPPFSANPGERPRSVTLVAWGVFLLGMINGWRAVSIYRQRRLLLDLDVTLDPAVIAIGAVVWSVLFMAAAVIIYRRHPSARWLTPVLLFTNTLFGFALTAIWGEAPKSSGMLRPTTFLSMAVLILVIWALNRRAARDYFIADHE